MSINVKSNTVRYEVVKRCEVLLFLVGMDVWCLIDNVVTLAKIYSVYITGNGIDYVLNDGSHKKENEVFGSAKELTESIAKECERIISAIKSAQ